MPPIECRAIRRTVLKLKRDARAFYAIYVPLRLVPSLLSRSLPSPSAFNESAAKRVPGINRDTAR